MHISVNPMVVTTNWFGQPRTAEVIANPGTIWEVLRDYGNGPQNWYWAAIGVGNGPVQFNITFTKNPSIVPRMGSLLVLEIRGGEIVELPIVQYGWFSVPSYSWPGIWPALPPGFPGQLPYSRPDRTPEEIEALRELIRAQKNPSMPTSHKTTRKRRSPKSR